MILLDNGQKIDLDALKCKGMAQKALDIIKYNSLQDYFDDFISFFMIEGGEPLTEENVIKFLNDVAIQELDYMVEDGERIETPTGASWDDYILTI